ncbi:hypothetical protein ACWEPC_25595 [Nonomuraea sp. NPDC004297]
MPDDEPSAPAEQDADDEHEPDPEGPGGDLPPRPPDGFEPV